MPLHKPELGQGEQRKSRKDYIVGVRRPDLLVYSLYMHLGRVCHTVIAQSIGQAGLSKQFRPRSDSAECGF